MAVAENFIVHSLYNNIQIERKIMCLITPQRKILVQSSPVLHLSHNTTKGQHLCLILLYVHQNKIYDVIYLLTAIGLSPSGKSTVHIYTKTTHRTIQNKQYIEQYNNFGRVWAVPRLG